MLNRGIIYWEQMSGIVYFANGISHSWYKKILQIKSFRLNITFFLLKNVKRNTAWLRSLPPPIRQIASQKNPLN